MKKLLVFAFVFAVVLGTVNAAVSAGNKDITGEWKFENPNAPYGYQKGSVVISEKEGKLGGEVKFADGYKIDLKDVSFTDNNLKFKIYVDYEAIGIKAKIEGKKMTGTANSPEGALPFTAEKVK